MPMTSEADDTGREKLLSAQRVAVFLDVPVQRVYELARLGLIPVVKLGRQRRFSPAALDAWVRAGGREAARDALRLYEG